MSNKGGHRHGLGRLAKTEFPAHWSDEQITRSIFETIKEYEYVEERRLLLFLYKKVDDVLVCVAYRKVIENGEKKLEFFTAYPYHGAGVYQTYSSDGKRIEVTEKIRPISKHMIPVDKTQKASHQGT